METQSPSPPQHPSASPSDPFRVPFTDALRFWEPRRLLYNLVLTVVTAVWVAATWPHFRPAFTLLNLLRLCFLALIANLCYCSAYMVDVPLLCSAAATSWKRRRWALWLTGMAMGVVLASYWIADEIYPDF
jgi:hypothetical protein